MEGSCESRVESPRLRTSVSFVSLRMTLILVDKKQRTRDASFSRHHQIILGIINHKWERVYIFSLDRLWGVLQIHVLFGHVSLRYQKTSIETTLLSGENPDYDGRIELCLVKASTSSRSYNRLDALSRVTRPIETGRFTGSFLHSRSIIDRIQGDLKASEQAFVCIRVPILPRASPGRSFVCTFA